MKLMFVALGSKASLACHKDTFLVSALSYENKSKNKQLQAYHQTKHDAKMLLDND